jgi:hypothetical protein
MSYSQLYDDIQGIHGKISTNYIRTRIIAITRISRIKEQWSAELDPNYMKGFYVEGPFGAPINISENEVLIVLSRKLDKHMRRVVLTKELMHTFDEEHELTNTIDKFDAQVERFCDPTVDASPQFKAETKAFWRALGVLCQEQRRLGFENQLKEGKISLAVVAAALQIPQQYARNLFRPDFLKIIVALK